MSWYLSYDKVNISTYKIKGISGSKSKGFLEETEEITQKQTNEKHRIYKTKKSEAN